jgi:flavin-dependent dehydrogenase
MAAAPEFAVMVVGASPAGLTAAVRATQLKLPVIVVERESAPRELAAPEWLGPAGIALCGECGLRADDVDARELTNVTLSGWDLSAAAKINDAEVRGWLFDRRGLTAALLERARAAGVTLKLGTPVVAVRRAERGVTATLADDTTARGQVLLLASGREAGAAALADVPSAAHTPPTAQCAETIVPAASDEPSLTIIVGSGRGVHVGAVVALGGIARLCVCGQSDADELRAALASLCMASVRTGLVASNGGAAASATVRPIGVALDLETHVGKHTLLVGGAGGFAAAFSGERLYPAMRSGWIAVEAVERALGASLPQDALQAFGALWRQALSDYLRLPNAELSLLLPLVLRNPQMGRRLVRAFLAGGEL